MPATYDGASARHDFPDIDKLPDAALLTRQQVSLLTGFAEITLKKWAAKGQGPKVTRVEGLPRFKVADVRAWLDGEAAEVSDA
ncbi:MAG: helix-turn-helix transcriptional regulator [Pseudomonadota bacterium]